MGLLKLRKNKKFSYEPRYYKGESNPFEIKHKFDEHRTTIGNNSGLKTKVVNALNDFSNNPNTEANKRVLVIAAILVLIFLFVIGFDVSIFFS